MNLALVRSDEKPAEKSASLRRELQDAICDRNAADARAKIAAEVFAKAERERVEAEGQVRQRQAELDAIRSAQTERAAKLISAAFRAGSPLPPMDRPPLDTAPLEAAQGRYDALSMAAHILRLEHEKAADAASLAASTVASIVASILEADARALAAEESAAFEAYWKIRDKLAGFVRIDETALADIADDMAKGLNRQARLARKDPLLMEPGHWMSHLDRIATGAERRWRDYASKLSSDASARFEEPTQ